MPELPEVENVRRQLSEQIPDAKVIQRTAFSGKDLRFPQNKKTLDASLVGHRLERFDRHGKYLFFNFDNGILVSHLGMTGHWRVEDIDAYVAKPHDHVQLYFDRKVLTFNDPRRFGFVLWQPQRDLEKLNLGPDALDWKIDDEFIGRMKKKSAPVKAVLLDQRIVAGIGNIYASEILFKSKIKPQRKASTLKLADWKNIEKATKAVLQAATKAGGSSIDDYLHPDGKPGGYQKRFSVYDRKGKGCPRCGQAILQLTQSGRSTYWCKGCQK